MPGIDAEEAAAYALGEAADPVEYPQMVGEKDSFLFHQNARLQLLTKPRLGGQELQEPAAFLHSPGFKLRLRKMAELLLRQSQAHQAPVLGRQVLQDLPFPSPYHQMLHHQQTQLPGLTTTLSSLQVSNLRQCWLVVIFGKHFKVSEQTRAQQVGLRKDV